MSPFTTRAQKKLNHAILMIIDTSTPRFSKILKINTDFYRFFISCYSKKKGGGGEFTGEQEPWSKNGIGLRAFKAA